MGNKASGHVIRINRQDFVSSVHTYDALAIGIRNSKPTPLIGDEAVKADIDKAFETSDNTEDPEPAGVSCHSELSDDTTPSKTSDEPSFTPLPDIAPERRDPLSPENTLETFLA